MSVDLPDAREPDQGHVGEQLELEAQPALLAHLALLGEGRGPPPVRQEPGVAAPAATALAGQPALPGADEVGEHDAVLVADGGALGHRHLEVAPPPAVLALALPVHAAPGRPVRMVLERDQRRHVAVDDEPHAAAVAAVAAVGPAPGHVRLPPEADRARAAVTTLDVETALVDELRHPARLRRGAVRPATEQIVRRRDLGVAGCARSGCHGSTAVRGSRCRASFSPDSRISERVMSWAWLGVASLQ